MFFLVVMLQLYKQLKNEKILTLEKILTFHILHPK